MTDYTRSDAAQVHDDTVNAILCGLERVQGGNPATIHSRANGTELRAAEKAAGPSTHPRHTGGRLGDYTTRDAAQGHRAALNRIFGGMELLPSAPYGILKEERPMVNANNLQLSDWLAEQGVKRGERGFIMPCHVENEGAIVGDQVCLTLYFRTGCLTADGARLDSFLKYPVITPNGDERALPVARVSSIVRSGCGIRLGVVPLNGCEASDIADVSWSLTFLPLVWQTHSHSSGARATWYTIQKWELVALSADLAAVLPTGDNGQVVLSEIRRVVKGLHERMSELEQLVGVPR